MTQAAYEELAEVTLPTTESPKPPAVEVVRRQRSHGLLFLIAIGSLVLIVGIAGGVMVAGEAIVHAFDPTSHVDVFAATHNHWVVGILLAITVLWLLPPYPWAKRAVAPGSPEQPARRAGEAGGGGLAPAIVRLDAPGPGPAIRPAEDREAGASPLCAS